MTGANVSQVEMEDDDTIDVYYEVRGGCSLECTGEI